MLVHALGKRHRPEHQRRATVFPPSENWVAAWHLGDDAATVQDGFKDATGVNHGTGHNLEKGSAGPVEWAAPPTSTT